MSTQTTNDSFIIETVFKFTVLKQRKTHSSQFSNTFHARKCIYRTNYNVTSVKFYVCTFDDKKTKNTKVNTTNRLSDQHKELHRENQSSSISC